MLRRLLPELGQRTLIMGVLNVTPDSFFDKGRFFDRREAIGRAIEMARQGADIIDIGGESTRPGAKEITSEEEIERVVPVIRAVARKIGKPISIDTRKANVADQALDAGAKIVNDVSGLRYDLSMADVVAEHKAAVILMHMKGNPQTMQRSPRYKNIIKEISLYLEESMRIAVGCGVLKKNIVVDPGIGFGKTLFHNLEILRRLREFRRLGCPVCVGTSRKSFIGKMLGSDDAGERLAGTIASCAVAIANGADILRVHDVREIVQAARVVDGIVRRQNGEIRR